MVFANLFQQSFRVDWLKHYQGMDILRLFLCLLHKYDSEASPFCHFEHLVNFSMKVKMHSRNYTIQIKLYLIRCHFQTNRDILLDHLKTRKKEENQIKRFQSAMWMHRYLL